MSRRVPIRNKAIQVCIRYSSIDRTTLEAAEQSEDVFDAVMMAVALLRCIMEGRPLHAPLTSPSIEGGILGTGTANMSFLTEGTNDA